MPRPHFTETMPRALLAELDARIRARHYGDYHALSEWLRGEGVQVSKSQLGLYGKRLRAADQRIRVDPDLEAANKRFQVAALEFELARVELIGAIERRRAQLALPESLEALPPT